jgi:hypothetical protein
MRLSLLALAALPLLAACEGITPATAATITVVASDYIEDTVPDGFILATCATGPVLFPERAESIQAACAAHAATQATKILIEEED